MADISAVATISFSERKVTSPKRMASVKAGIDHKINRDANGVADRLSGHNATMAPHECRCIVAEGLRETASLFEGPNEQVGVAEFVAYIPDWYFASHSSGRMDDLAHGHFRDRVRNDLVSVIVHHRVNVRPALIDRAMYWALAIHGAPALIDRIAIEIKLHDVVQADKFGAPGPRHKKPVRTLRKPHTNMAETVNHAFSRQDTIGDYQVFKHLVWGFSSALSEIVGDIHGSIFRLEFQQRNCRIRESCG